MPTPTSPYMHANGRDLDVQRFATDLATAIGGEAATGDSDNIGTSIKFNGDTVPDCDIPGALTLTVWRARDSQTAEVRVYPSDVPEKYINSYFGRNDQLPSIRVSTAKPMDRIVKDIKRRLFSEAAEPIAARRARAQEAMAFTSKTQQNAETIRQRIPALKIRNPQHSDADPVFYINIAGIYLDGRVQGDSVTFDRGSVSVENFVRMMEALNLPDKMVG